MNTDTQLIILSRTIAVRHRLDPVLVCAVVDQESSWDTYAMRYEPRFRERYVADLGLNPTEEIARSISWGLMQVMGQVARENGFDAKFLSEICSPEIGLDVGCIALAKHFRNGCGDIAKVLTLWNGGADPQYAARVAAKMARYELASL
jgi:soluble lytic murein transglycosylase-like protein